MLNVLFRFLPLVLLLITVPPRAQAQDLSPELQFGARGVVSGNVNAATDQTTTAVSDFSDTAVLMGARQRLFHNWRGQMVVGFQFPDADSELGQVFFHRVFIHVENERNAFHLGRTRLASTLVEFPTLRDDDALLFTDVVSPFSDGHDSEDSQFGNVIEATRFLTHRVRIELHGEHYDESDNPEDFSLNAAGVSLIYHMPQSQRWNRAFLDQLALSIDGFFTDRTGHDDKDLLTNVKAAMMLNVYPDPVHYLQLSHQAIYNVGFEEIEEVRSFPDMARARSVATFTALSYQWRQYEWPTLRGALGVGFKAFPDLRESASQVMLLGNLFYRLGANFDIGVQLQQTWNDDALAAILDRRTTGFKLALIYSVDQRFNNQFDDRDSILNLEHGYVE